jgi:GT2 family glycosyltransferase
VKIALDPMTSGIGNLPADRPSRGHDAPQLQAVSGPAPAAPRISPGLPAAPRVSVIVLNHNGEKIIAKCLEHLLAQTFDDFEIVVVDNNSADGSLPILERYLVSGRLSIVRARRNLGVAGGRNLGVRHAQGAIIAFIDNDGYAHPRWLAEVVKTIDSDPRIGVVASVVFFANRKVILNGVGGTVNYQGYGGDFCFDTPYEFAQLPRRVLYAMGCGMVVRKDVLDRLGPLDEKLFNYYDDTELGIRAWKSGFEVAVAPEAWVDHGFSYSDKILNNKTFLCERNRIRTILKYFPPSALAPWFVREIRFSRRFEKEHRSIILRAWMWNLRHLPSALRLRLKFALRRNSFWNLLDPSWGHFPPPHPNNQVHRPDLALARHFLWLDGKSDAYQLNFGWYEAEHDGILGFRWSAPQASAFFKLRTPAVACALTFHAQEKERTARILVRRLGSLEPVAETIFRLAPQGWQRRVFPMHLEPGIYEAMLLCEEIFVDSWGRPLGAAVSAIEFE